MTEDQLSKRSSGRKTFRNAFCRGAVGNILFLAVCMLFGAPAASHAQTSVSGAIATDTTWTSANSPYRVTGNVTVNEGITLTVEPGVRVEFQQNLRLSVGGTLSAIGTSENPIVFTGTTETPGWWQGIFVLNAGSATLAHCEIAYAGNSYHVDGANRYVGLYKSGTGDLSITDTTIRNISGDGLRINNTAGTISVTNNQFENNRYAVLQEIGDTVHYAGNTFSGNTFDGVVINGGTRNADMTLTSAGSPYRMAGNLTVPADVTLTLEPGVRVEFQQNLRLSVGGTLTAIGTSENPIVFTGTTETPGWWQGIFVLNAGSAALEHCEIAYAGNNHHVDGAHRYVGLYKSGTGALSLKNSTIRDVSGNGLQVLSGYSSFLSRENIFRDNTRGVRVGINVSFDDDTSHFLNNSAEDVYLDDGTIDREVVWNLNSAYSLYASGSINVSAGGLLRILPGTVVKFARNAGLSIHGGLEAKGTAAARIYFTDLRDDAAGGDANKDGDETAPAPGWWRGIFVRGAGSATLAHCEISYAGNSHYVDGANRYVGLYKAGTGDLSITDTTIRDISGDGLQINNTAGTVSVTNNQFENNRYAVLQEIGDTVHYAENTFSGNTFDGVVINGGTRNADMTLTSAGSPYRMAGNLTVPADVTLTLEPGVRVEFQQNLRLSVGGTLSAIGTSENPIVFTGTTETPGWWQGIFVRNAGSGAFEHCEIAYAGNNHHVDGAHRYVGLYKSGEGALSLKNSTIRDVSGNGLQVLSGYSSFLSQENTFRDNTRGVRVGVNVSFDDDSSQFSGNSAEDVYLDDGTIDREVVWNLDSAYSLYASGSMTVSEGALLRILPGTVVKFAQNAGLSIHGGLEAKGTAAARIYFTDLRDDAAGGDANKDGDETAPAPGWWRGIFVRNAGSATLAHCEIAYAGNSYHVDGAHRYVGLYKSGTGDLSITDTTIRDTDRDGLRIDNSTGDHEIVRCTFSANRTGVFVQSQAETLVLIKNRIQNNTDFGVRSQNSVDVDARNNWWGDATGPYHAALNPQGLGDAASDGVLIDFWRTRPGTEDILSPTRSGAIVAGDSLRFSGRELDFPDAVHLWDFGDGRVFSGPDPGVVAFPETGVFEVTYTALPAEGLSPWPDSRFYTVVEDTEDAADLNILAENLAVPDSLLMGATVTVDYSVENAGPGALTGRSWTDAVYLSREPHLSSDAVMAGRASIEHELDAGGQYSGGIRIVVPPGAEGEYYLIVSVDDRWQVLDRRRRNNEASVTVNLLVPELERGVPHEAGYPAGAFTHCYRLEAKAGENPVVEILPAELSGLTLAAALNRQPCLEGYDYQSKTNVLALPAETDGTWYLSVSGTYMAQAGSYTIQFDTVGLVLQDVTPKRAGVDSPVHLALAGMGFTDGVRVELVDSEGRAYAAESETVESYTQMTAEFGAGMLSIGRYSVRVIDAQERAVELADLVEVVVSTTVEAGALSEDAVWGGLVQLQGNVRVPEGITLEILPGSVLEFPANARLDVAGLLDVLGTVDHPVRFTSAKDPDPDLQAAPGDWQGLRVDENGTLLLRSFEIRYAQTAIHVIPQMITRDLNIRIEMTNGIISDNSGYGIHVYQPYVEVFGENVVFADNGYTAIFIRADSRHVFRNCTVTGNGFEGSGWSGAGIHHGASTFTLDNCIVAFNANGIHHSGAVPNVTIRNSLFYNPDGAEYVNPRASEAGILERNGNITADPLFVGREEGNHELDHGSPAVDSGRGMHAPAQDILGRPRFDDLGMPNSGTGYPAYVDMGAYERQTHTQSADLAVVGASRPVPQLLGAGESFTVDWFVVNEGNRQCQGPWEDAVYLSGSGHVNPDMAALGTRVFEGTLGPGEGYAGALTAAAPLKKGIYYLMVRADSGAVLKEPVRSNNDRFAAGVLAVDLPRFGAGGSVSGTVAQARWDHALLNAEAGNTLLLKLQPDRGTVGLYVRHGAPPTLHDYDYRVTGAGEQVLRLLSPRSGDYFVGVYGARVPAGSTGYTLSAELTDLAIEQVGPGTVGAAGEVTLRISGDNFEPGSRVQAVAPDGALIEAQVFYQDPSTLYAMFDPPAAGMNPGGYDIRVTQPDLSTVIQTNALTLQAGGWAELAVNLRRVPGVARPGRNVDVIVEYTNTGNIDLSSPLLTLRTGRWVSAAGGNRWIESEKLNFLALSSSGPAAILRPGQSETVTISTRTPWAIGKMSISLGAFGLAGDPGLKEKLDWAQLAESLRPVDAWNPLMARLEAQIGATWGDYLAAMRENANHLGGLGLTVYDADELFAFEVVQAATMGTPPFLETVVDAYCPAPGMPLRFERSFLPEPSLRSRMGPLGRGWVHAHQIHLSESPDRTVAIHNPTARHERIFQPDGIGYYGAAGDYATLEKLPDGGFLLIEQNGTEIRFDSDGRWGEITDTNGNRVSADYDGQGRLAAVTHSNGDRFSFEYLGDRLAQLIDHAGRITHYTYDASGEHLLSVTGPDGGSTGYTYLTGAGPLRDHLLTRITTPDGLQTNFSYDGFGRLASHDIGGEQAVNYSYGRSGRFYITDALGNTGTFWLDGRGRTVMAEDPLGERTHFDYNGQNRNEFGLGATQLKAKPSDMSFPEGLPGPSHGPSIGRRLQDPDGRSQIAAGGHGRLERVTGPTGLTESLSYDGFGNPVSLKDPMGYETTFGYGGPYNNLLWIRDARGNATHYSYDARGNLSRITYEDGSYEDFQYDAAGNLAARINGRGQTIKYAYNARGQVTGKSYPGPSGLLDQVYTYDAAGNLISAAGSNGATAFTYDPATQFLARIDLPAAGSRELSLVFEYDAGGRRTKSEDQDGHLLHYHYDAAGRLDRMTCANDEPVVDYEYDAAGRLVLKTLGNGVYTTYAYDAASQLVSLVNRHSDGKVLSRYDYTYDGLGRRVSMDTHFGSWSYQYDDNGQLVRAVLASADAHIPDQDLNYAYDAVGNRTVTLINGETTHYTVNNMNQYIEIGDRTYVFDADGNLVEESGPDGTTLYLYDPEGRLTGVFRDDDSWEYAYDAMGRYLTIAENGVVTRYVVDIADPDNIIGEYDAAGNATARYDYGYGLIRRTTSAGVSHYYTFDALGNTSELTPLTDDANGRTPQGILHLDGFRMLGQVIPMTGPAENSYVYSPDGKTILNTDNTQNPFQFMGEDGGMTNATGITQTGTFKYKSSLGRYTSRNPRSRDVNRYRHENNAPKRAAKPRKKRSDYYQWTEAWRDSYYVSERAADLDDSIIRMIEGRERFMKITPKVATDMLKYDVKEDIPVIGKPWQIFNTFKMLRDMAEGGGLISADGQEVGSGNITLRTSITPEDKFGPAGYSDPGAEPGSPASFLRPGETMAYRIEFWNKEDAEVPTQDADIVDDLNPEVFDFSTFEFTRIGFLDWDVFLPAGQTSIDHWIDARPKMNLAVHVRADFDPETGRIYWWFHCVDPETGDYPDDPNVGFLPPFNPVTQYELGWVEYRLRTKKDLESGTLIKNQARVRFDFLPFGDPPPVEDRWDEGAWEAGWGPAPKEGPWVNTIAADPPVSRVNSLPPVTTIPVFDVSWTGQDMGGAGIEAYRIYVRVDDGPYTLWLTTAETSAVFAGECGRRYSFYSVAVDNVGNLEEPPDVPDATIHIPALMGDVDGSGEVDLADLILVLQGLSQIGEVHLGVNVCADVDGDGRIGLAEAIYILQELSEAR